jgi:hypothetical protein
MKLPLRLNQLRAAAIALLSLGAFAGVAHGNPAAHFPDLAVAPKSAFLDDPSVGKDPFYPKSSRRPIVKVVPVVNPTVPPPPPAVPPEIRLNGLSAAKDQKLAVINYYTFAAGEEHDLRVNGKVYRVRCEEIRERSIVVSVQGATNELQLRNGL